MNPFGIFQAAIAVFEGAAQAADPKRQKETKSQKRRFLFLYVIFMLLGIGVVVWTIRSLYFSK